MGRQCKVKLIITWGIGDWEWGIAIKIQDIGIRIATGIKVVLRKEMPGDALVSVCQ